MLLDCSEMEVPVAMIHVLGTMLYPTDDNQRRAWITWGILKMFQRIESQLKYENAEEMLDAHVDIGSKIGLLAIGLGGLSTFIQNIYADRDIYSTHTNHERAQIGLRAGNILNTALLHKESIAGSTIIIHTSLIDKTHRDKATGKIHSPNSEEKNTWNKFRSVAHLWAAANKHWHDTSSLHSIHQLADLASLFVNKEKFTTELSDRFDDFLNTADKILSYATAPKLGMCKHNKPILNRETSWDVLVPANRDNDLMVFYMKGMPT